MRSKFPLQRPTIPALLAALGIGAAVFVASWLMLGTPDGDSGPTAATLQVRSTGAEPLEATIEASVAELLSPENIASAMQDARFPGTGNGRNVSITAIESVRERLRADIGVANEVGVQTTTIRWIGDPHQAGAARLVNILVHQLAAKLPEVQLRPHEAQSSAVQRELRAAEQAVDEANRRFESALVALRDILTSSTEPVRAQPIANVIAPSSAKDEDTVLQRQRLADLEARRQTLAERLMPEHPEMKALDERIDQLRSSVAIRGNSAVDRPSNVPTTTTTKSLPGNRGAIEAAQAEVDVSRQALRTTQVRYQTAQSRQRAALESLAKASHQLTLEIAPASPTAPRYFATPPWKRFLISALAAVLCGGLVIAGWPEPRALATAEEVRCVTRLPVVVIESAALN